MAGLRGRRKKRGWGGRGGIEEQKKIEKVWEERNGRREGGRGEKEGGEEGGEGGGRREEGEFTP